jgi:UDP-glucose 4-epimerase
MMQLRGSNWLVIGGCGYIGSEVARHLKQTGAKVIILDDLSTGFINRLPGFKTIVGDASNPELIEQVCADYEIYGVVHCAGKRQARESVQRPTKYWFENLSPTLGLIKGLTFSKVKHVIFSSSCSVYGTKSDAAVDGDCKPESTYGFTKLYSEKILSESLFEQSRKLTVLRYFNVIGASGGVETSDFTTGAIVPTFVTSAISNDDLEVFGHNFSTPDGTSIRDYIDVKDLAAAHVVAAKFGFQENRIEPVLNISTGKMTSTLEIAQKVIELTESKSKIIFKDSVVGDPASIFADPSKNLLDLGWKANVRLDESIQSHISSIKGSNRS